MLSNIQVSKNTSNTRRDIQFLRGIAVLAVVLYHADIPGFAQGFLGVDVFFVISGFLITSIILRELEQGTFSFSGFYLRRAKRLLPAIYVTLVMTSLAAHFFLTQSQWVDYIEQVIGAVTFTENIILPTQTGYFENAADGKPLLHIWSLSLEEQYYLTLPLALYFMPRALRGVLIGFLLILSLGLCFYLVTMPIEMPKIWGFPNSAQDLAFYSFPTRAWELLAGSLAAWLMFKKPESTIDRRIKWLALCLVLSMFTFILDPIHPRLDAILVVLATSLLIIGKDNWLPKMGPITIIERVGDWSYSLYLVHWPLFAFAYSAYLGWVPFEVKLVLIVFAFLLAYFQYRYIEQPFRYGWKQKPLISWVALGISTVLVLLINTPVLFAEHGRYPDSPEDWLEIRRFNNGLAENCSLWGENIQSNTLCTTGPKPLTAIWGDSYAGQLTLGLMNNPTVPAPISQLTKTSCGPFLNIVPVSTGLGENWAKECIKFNNSALKVINDTDSIRYVVLAASFGRYVKTKQKFGHSSKTKQKLDFYDGETIVSMDLNQVVDNFVGTITALKSAGKVPLLVSPAPTEGFNIGECHERKSLGLVVLRSETCAVLLDKHLQYNDEVLQTLETISRRTGVKLISLDQYMCDSKKCRTKSDSAYYYVDSTHLSKAGSIEVLGKPDLAHYFH